MESGDALSFYAEPVVGQTWIGTIMDWHHHFSK